VTESAPLPKGPYTPIPTIPGFEDRLAIMNIEQEVVRILDEVLGLKGRGLTFTRDTLLLGAVPELDSMAVVSAITTLEERLGVMIDDDEIDGSTFASVGSLVDLLVSKTAH
jgi:acyl carrier protein